MKKEFNSMLIILICGVLGIVTAIIITNLYNQGIFFDELITGTITLQDLQTIIILSWIFIGVIIGVMKN